MMTPPHCWAMPSDEAVLPAPVGPSIQITGMRLVEEAEESVEVCMMNEREVKLTLSLFFDPL